ncbi:MULTISPECIES: site-specific integrase [unclassified Streptomyces]|uniref:tyrosine-type recombinase/integrase n=1 Tax=unclassified Streptomyces TaxID=2593676 RepID=UPI000823ED7E|nr:MULTISPECIES: site-specific integrase [unclassified Streptomyces]MYT99967.1 tyrosine-type recombinase/integrase [Streptomyces sp. SID8350]SCK52397.1 Integrase [Streptomyces sp. AmelKG-D3]
MAYIETKERRGGDATFVVRWRAAGARNGKRESESFDDLPSAEKFRDLVKAHGEHWPPGWTRGHGFVADRRRKETMFEPFALAYVDRLTGIQGDTRSKYKKRIRANMVPWFGSYSVEDGEGTIRREMVQDWVNDLEAGRLAPLDPSDRKPRTKYRPKTVQNEHGLLFSILQSAVDAEPSLRASNPCAKTRLPRLDGAEDEEEMVFLEREEWAWIYECLSDDAKDLGEALAETGLRWGEVTALQPRDLRRRNGRPAIRVQRAWKKDEDGKSILGAPKTRKARRTVVITWRLDRVLRHRAKGLARDALLFTGPEGGKWDPGTFRRLRWLPAIELAAEKFGLLKRPRIHDLRHSHASWLIAAKVPLPAVQGRLGHESITTTVDRYGHLLDALDDEVMAAVEWAMDPTAPLPGFLSHSGLADATDGLPRVPRQLSGLAHETWKDASDKMQDDAEHRSDLVFVVTLGGREVPFADREHAQDVADQWNDDHADEIEALRSDGWPEEKIARHGAVGPEERERWTGAGPVWTRMPERQFVHYTLASYEPDGTLTYEPPPMSSRWTWEFEHDGFTVRAAEFRTEFRPQGSTEAHARGINKAAVARAFEQARLEAEKACAKHPDADLASTQA